MKQRFSLLLLAISLLGASQIKAEDATPAVENTSDSKTVFLTGACGFIGSSFVKYIFDHYPKYRILVLDALTYAGNLDNIPAHIKNSDRFEFHYGSVTNHTMVDYLMSRADFVVHFAAESHVTRSIYDPSQFFKTDVIGTRVMMDALVKYSKKVQRFIHISTSEVLGTAEYEPMDEKHPLNPRSPYAGAKAGADRLVYSYWCTYDVPALIIRPFNNYGPQQHTEKLIPRMITNAIKREQLTVHGTGEQKRDWVFTNDTCRALDKALHIEDFSKIKNQVIHIGTGKPVSVIEIAKSILKYFDLPESYITYVGDRPGQVECHISSTEKSKQLLGWESETTFESGMNEVINWYLGNKKRWKKMEPMKQVPILTLDGKIEAH